MNTPTEYANVLAVILEQLALACDVPHVHEHERLGNMALDSIEVTGLMAGLGLQLGVELEPTLFWTYPTPAELARHITGFSDEVAVASEARNTAEPVAITGLACRFPGAMDANAYWHLLIEGKSAVAPLSPAHFQEFPSSPWHVDADEVAGFLDEVSGFDHEQFGIGAHEASCMDPQQRLLLELSWTALEQAGMNPATLRGQRGGVYVGAMWSDFSHHLTPGDMSAQSATGMDTSILSARLSFVLGLNGPSLTVNTACSSSLVALHLACQAIRNDECDFAVVAGVNLLLAAQSFAAMRRFGGLSETGACHTFDAAADGYVRAEGCGVLIIRRLSRALIDASPVWGVIRSSVINNNGYHGSLTAPSVMAQQQLLREACVQAGLQPGDIQYVEAHGTGTAMGDPIEVSAISAAYCQGVERDQSLLIGSVKTNIGHSEAAAGMAGLIKVLLAMRHGLIPAHLNYQTSNPVIDWKKLGLQLVTQARSWDAIDRMAGVSSFGFGGTNAHIIVSETWPCLPVHGAKPVSESASDDAGHLMQVSASPLNDGRALLVFPGQGAHWQGMGLHYARLHPVFREVIKRCDRWVRQFAGWSLAQRLYDDQETFSDVRIAWPCHLAMQLAITEVWLAKGLQVAGVIGHSIGEVTAAHVAGLVTLDDAFRIILAQAEWANRHRGSMALMSLDWLAAQRLLDDVRSSARCAIQHSDKETVITGDLQALQDIQPHCQRMGVHLSTVRTCVSVHGQVSDDDRQQLIHLLGDLPGSTARLHFYSCVRGGELLNRLPEGYWSDSISRPIRWFDALQHSVLQCAGPIVEVAPHPVLNSSIHDALRVLRTEREVLVSGRRGRVDGAAMTKALQRYPQPFAAVDPWEGLHLLLLSGHSIDALNRRCLSIADWLTGDHSPNLGDCAKALLQCSDHYRYRLTLVVANREEAIRQLLQMVGQTGSQAHDIQGLAPPSLLITEQVPFTEKMHAWLKQFSMFSAAYTRVILAGQDRQFYSQMLEAAAQQIGWIALMTESGVVYEGYQASGPAVAIVELIEGRVSLNSFLDSLMADDKSLGFYGLTAEQPVDGGGKGSAVIALSLADQLQRLVEEGDDPARVFLELLAGYYRTGSRITGFTDRERPLLTLPAMVCRVADLQPVAHGAGVVGELSAQPAAAAYRLAWKQATPSIVEPQVVEQILVLADHDVTVQLQARGTFAHAQWYCLDNDGDDETALVGGPALERPGYFASLLEGRSISTVVFVWHTAQPLTSTGSSLKTALLLLQYVQSMPGKPPSLHFVTLGGQAVVDARILNPAATMAWGLIRTAQLELGDVCCSLVDIDPPTKTGVLTDSAINALSMSLNTGLDQSAWREGQLFTPVLVEKTDIKPFAPLDAPASPGYHLITGGFGALGLELLHSLFARGERRFLLIGRTPPAERASEVIGDLREAGAEILIHAGDVTDLERLSAVVRNSAQTLGPLTAITHAAGVLEAGPLATVSPGDFEASLAAKEAGALNLHTISEQWPVTRFVLVSSVSTLFGFARYAAYAAANSYLDGLAGYRQALGLPGLSVCYGPFLAKGLLDKLDPAMSFGWLAKMHMREGLDLLSACSSEQGVLAIMRYSGPAALGNTPRVPIVAAPTYSVEERRSELCKMIKRFVAILLQQPVEAIPMDTPLSELGVSSLLGVEVRNRLQTELSVRMPATVLWNYPTVSSLAGYLESLLWPPSATPPVTAMPVCSESPAIAADDSEEALMAQLLEELATIKDTYKMGAH
ncbi:SDR family NAD(P)-dependent oxidoreductase [Pseudomonas frederiksbergensis]|uniref:SDR family NAD(P)-dependent oxidoreductase n=1 Tax=Pseudomonas frederiksbergensis TaxID=104087 RepID=UPI003D1D604B